MSSTDTACEPALLAAEPQLYTRDLAAALRFYRERLGFDLVFSYGEPPFYAQIARGGARLNLRLARGPVFEAGFREREVDALSAAIPVRNIEPLFREVQAAGADLHQPLRREPWGARTFIVPDLDGNLIGFAGD